uniref:Putative secreted peptide n=1 Tax=Anopheles braziliensis TaxID=58242 RepID=A0A2M3ZW38_9DIPT
MTVVVVVVAVVSPYRAVPGPEPEPEPSAFRICDCCGGQVKEWKFIYHKNRVTRVSRVRHIQQQQSPLVSEFLFLQ